MPIWLVKATWIEDEAEVSEQWEVNAAAAHDAVKAVTTHLRFQPHHVEARRRLSAKEEETPAPTIPPGQTRRLPPQ